MIFSIEYGVRLFCCPNRRAFVMAPLNIVDLLAILPCACRATSAHRRRHLAAVPCGGVRLHHGTGGQLALRPCGPSGAPWPCAPARPTRRLHGHPDPDRHRMRRWERMVDPERPGRGGGAEAHPTPRPRSKMPPLDPSLGPRPRVSRGSASGQCGQAGRAVARVEGARRLMEQFPDLNTRRALHVGGCARTRKGRARLRRTLA